jgi:hypothetical protein
MPYHLYNPSGIQVLHRDFTQDVLLRRTPLRRHRLLLVLLAVLSALALGRHLTRSEMSWTS